jgi:hypothetical protein
MKSPARTPLTPEAKDELVTAYQKAVVHIPIVKKMEDLLETAVTGVLGEGFNTDKKTGVIVLREGVDPVTAYVAGFKALADLNDKGEYMASGFAFHEAKLALSAKHRFGNDWPNYFPSNAPTDVMRIRKNLRSLEGYIELGGTLKGHLTMWMIRYVTERAYDKFDPTNNNRLKSETIKKMEKISKSSDKLTRVEILKMVNEAAVGYKKPAQKSHWAYGYFMVDWETKRVGLVGSITFDDQLASQSAMVIDWPGRLWLSQDQTGEWVANVVGTIAGAPTAEVLERQAMAQNPEVQRPPPEPEPVPSSTQLADDFFRERYNEVVNAQEPEELLKQMASPTTVRDELFPTPEPEPAEPEPQERKAVAAAVDPLAGIDFGF